MRRELEKYELIEKYLLGKLESNELEEIENKIQSDPDFAREVSNHRTFQNFIFDRAMVDIKIQIRQIHQKNTPLGSSKSPWRNFFIFSGSILIIGLILFIILSKHEKEPYQSRVVVKNEITMTSDAAKAKKDIEVVANLPQKVSNDEALLSSNQEITITNEQSEIPEKKPTGNKELKTIAPVSDIPVPVEKKPVTIKEVPKLQEPPLKTDCLDVSISGKIQTENSCSNKPTGKISIDAESLNGGQPPYLLSIDGGKSFRPEMTIARLMPSAYKVYLKDANNCVSWLEDILLKSVNCSYDFVFSPDKGEVWKIPTIETYGDLQIFNKQGQIVYKETYDMPGDFEWDGRTNASNELPMGVYMFVLKITDRETITGNVTIVR